MCLGLLSGCAFDYDVGNFVTSGILVLTGVFALAEGMILHNFGGLPAIFIRYQKPAVFTVFYLGFYYLERHLAVYPPP